MLVRDVPCWGATFHPCGRLLVSYVTVQDAVRDPVARSEISTSWLMPGLTRVTDSGDWIRTA